MISVARALIELKTLDKRIEKKIEDFRPVSAQVGDNPEVSTHKLRAEYNTDVVATYQGICDLIRRRRDLKAMVVKSNAGTEVNINGKKMTVAEAIEMKTSIGLDQNLRSCLSTTFDDVHREVAQQNQHVKQRLDTLLQHTFQKDSSKVKPDEYDAVAKPFMLKNEYKMLDPIGALDKAKALDAEIDAFMSEVDIALTESNATTNIEI